MKLNAAQKANENYWSNSSIAATEVCVYCFFSTLVSSAKSCHHHTNLHRTSPTFTLLLRDTATLDSLRFGLAIVPCRYSTACLKSSFRQRDHTWFLGDEALDLPRSDRDMAGRLERCSSTKSCMIEFSAS